MVSLADIARRQDNLITDILQVEFESSGYWTAYRKIIAALSKQEIKGIKQSNRWLIESPEEVKTYLEGIKPIIKRQNVNEKNVNIEQIKTLIMELEECKVPAESIILLIKRKLQMD